MLTKTSMRNLLFALALFTLIACSWDNSSEEHLNRAKEFIAASDTPSAMIELQNAVQLDAASAEARWLLGKLQLDAGEVQSAEKEFQRAQELGWTANDVRPLLAKSMLAQGKFSDVLALDSNDLDSPAAALLLSSQVMAALSLRQMDTARELLAQALKKAPQLLEAKLAQATLAVYEGDPTDALNFVEAILAGAPDTGEAWWIKGQALVQQGKLEEARAAFDQSIANSKIGFADRVARAFVNVQLEDYDAAQADVTELLKRGPKNATANYIQGLLFFQRKEYRDAITALTLAIPAVQQFPFTLYYLSLSYLFDKNLPLAERFGNKFVALQPDDAKGRKLLAAISLRQDKVKRARKAIEPVLDHDPYDVQALNIMANALLLDGQADLGMLLYARIAQLRPDWRIVPLRRETGLVAPGAADEGQPTAGMPENTANYPQTEILSILNHLAEKDFPAAIEAATNYHMRDFDGLAPYRVLGRVYLAAGKPAEAKAAFENALQREPGDPFTSQHLAEMALAAGDPDAARRYCQTALDRHPGDLTILLQLSALEASEKNEAAMIDRLNQAIKAHPMALAPRLRMAGHYLGSGNAKKVEPLFANLTELQRGAPQVLELQGMAQLAQHQNDSAVATLQQLVDADPTYAQAHYLLALAADASGNRPKAKRELREAVQRDAKHMPALINLAKLAQSDGEQEQLAQYLETLNKLTPDHPEVLRLRAWSAQAAGNNVEALALSQRVFKAAPTSQTVLELTAYQKAAGKNQLARSTLLQWVGNQPKDIDVRLVLANDLTLENDLPGAQAQYLAVLEHSPGSITALNNLAWNLRLQNPRKALEYIRKAATLAPDHTDVLDTLAVIEFINGNHESARRDIQRALTARPDDVSIRYHEAMIVAALGDKAQAIAALEKLVTNDASKFPERAEAEALLKSLKG
jgi:putative PEP-CTERM system TPR-repeat lipoprotein